MAKKKNPNDLTPYARRKYIRSAGSTGCPWCGQDEDSLRYEELCFVEDGHIEQRIHCGCCNREWLDIFRMSEIRPIRGVE